LVAEWSSLKSCIRNWLACLLQRRPGHGLTTAL
jgi:hypothetical protein